MDFKKFLNELKKITSDFLDKKEDLYVYAFDTSQNPDVVTLPLAVVFPKNKFEVSKIAKLCNDYNIAIIPRAQGTNHCGATRASKNSIVMHFSKMNKIISIDKENLIAIVEPNVIIKDLNDKLDKLNLFFPPDPSNLAVSTLGGAIALCSGGARTFKYSNTKDYVINLEVVLANGEIIETSKNLAKNVTGYNLTSLFVGSEGTLGLITKATLKLIPKPKTRMLTLCYFDNLYDASKCTDAIISSGLNPASIDLIDDITIKTIEKFNPCDFKLDKKAMLLIEQDGFSQCVEFEQKILRDVLIKQNIAESDFYQTKNEEENENIYRARRSAFGALAQLKPNVVTEDIVVARNKIFDLIKKIEHLSKKYNIMTAIMGHIGDGNIHPNFALDLSNETEKNNFEKLKDELFSYAISLDGTLSGEHGIGNLKRKYLDMALQDNSHKLMKEIKKLLDPKNILNPNKAI